MQVLIKTVDGCEETAYTQADKAISTLKNVATFPLEIEPSRDSTGSKFDRFIHLDNLVFYRYYPEQTCTNSGTKTVTVKTRQGTFEEVTGVTHIVPSNFYLVVVAENCVTNFPLKNVLSYDVE